MCASPEGGSALSGGWDGDARLWNLDNGGGLISGLETDERGFESVAFGPERRFLLLGSAGKVLLAWDLSTGRYDRILDACDTVAGLAVTRGGRYLLTGGRTDVQVHELDWEWALPTFSD